MARYAVEADLLGRMSNVLKLQLFDDDHDGVVDPGLVETVLEMACDETDLELSAYYATPLGAADVSGSITYLTVCVAWYLAHARKNLTTDQMYQDYKDCLGKLQRIGENKTGTGLDPRPEEREGVVVLCSSATKIMGRTNMAALP